MLFVTVLYCLVSCSASLLVCQPDVDGGISWTAALVGTTQTADCPDGNGKIKLKHAKVGLL